MAIIRPAGKHAGQVATIDRVRGGVEFLYRCPHCLAEIGNGIGAQYVAVGWVQKVSNLILNVNIEIREEDLRRSIADALQFISYYHPADFIRHLAAAHAREESAPAKAAMAQAAGRMTMRVGTKADMSAPADKGRTL